MNGGAAAAEKKAVGTAGCCPGPAAIGNLRFGRAYRCTVHSGHPILRTANGRSGSELTHLPLLSFGMAAR